MELYLNNYYILHTLLIPNNKLQFRDLKCLLRSSGNQ